MAKRTPSATGRPRDPSFDERALAAVRELLAERGFAATTVQAIAERSGVHVSAIYRRWPSRVDLLEDAVFPGLDPPSVAPSGDLVRDLRRFLRSLTAIYEAPAARAAIPGLLAEYQRHGRPGAEQHWLRVSGRPYFRDILRAAPAGSVDPDIDPDDVFDLLQAAALARVLVPTTAQRRRPLERTVELLVRALQPAGVSRR
jgi:AcrR family transcriptional regulator